MASPLKANRYFTNRENHFISFNNAIKSLKDKKYSVLSFYGVGGIGKSRLKEELIKTVEDTSIVISSSLNFQQEEYRNVSTALYLLYKDLKSKKIQFPTFEIAHAIHWQKVHPGQSISKSGVPYIEEGSLVFDIISITQDIPIVGLIPKIGSMLYKAKIGFDKWWTKNGERELKSIQQLEPHQIEEYLPYYFALDLKDYIETHSKSIIFFVDTYENLWKTEEDRGKSPFSKDRWVRKLIQYLPQTLWVILGRERLRWDEVNEDINWKEFLDQHLLGELSPNDANKFLEHCSIKEQDIRNKIIQTSKGLPFYLELQVDTYNRIIENGNTPSTDKFGKNYDKVLERFEQYLSANETRTLQLLSCSKIWDYTIFEKIISNFKIGVSTLYFDDLLRFSFVSEVASKEEEDSYTIHQIMRQHFKENLSSRVRSDAHRLLLTHHEELLNAESPEILDIESKNFIELTPKIARFLDEILYHKRKIEKPEIYYQWLLGISQKLYGKINSTSIQDALEKAKNDLVFSDNYLLLIKISYEIARLYSWKNDDVDALNYFIQEGLRQIDVVKQEKYRNSNEEISKKEPELIQLRVNFLLLQAELSQDLGSNNEAYNIYLNAFSIGKQVGYYPSSISYARLLKILGRIPEAEGFFYKELHNVIINKDTENQAFYYNEIGRLFVSQKLNNIAKVYFAKSLDLYEGIKGKEHNYCWIVRHRYAQCLISTGELEKAQTLLNDILEWWKSNYGETYFELGYIYLSMAKCTFSLKKYSSSIEYCFQAIHLLSSKLGSSNTEVTEAQLLFCEIIQELNNNGGLHTEGFDEDDINLLNNMYDSLIVQFEYGFYWNYKNILKNSGFNSSVTNSFFKVIGQYYNFTNNYAKKTVLDRRKAETHRVFHEQFRIREFEQEEKIKIEGGDKVLLLNKLEKELGIICDVPLEIFKSSLPYFKDTFVYHLYYSDTVIKYILGNEDFVSYLDYTNAPIYDLADKNEFILSSNMVIDYVYFFFDAVKGPQGKFSFPKNSNDIPLCIDIGISDEVINNIKCNINEPQLLEVSQDYILLEGNCFFKDSLFKTKVKISSNGQISMSDEELVLEGLPIAIEPQFNQVIISNEDIIKQIILLLEGRFKFIPIDDVDTEIYNNFYDNVLFTKENFETLNIQDSKIPEIFDDALYLMNKYIKPMYDNELVYRREIGQTLDVMNSILQESELIKKRELIQLNLRVLGNNGVIFTKEAQEETIAKLLNHSIITEKPVHITKNNLTFYPNTSVYTLVLENGRTKYILDSGDMIYMLDSTNRPIYNVSDKDFTLSVDTVAEYVIFFFDSVIEKHGKFYIPISKNDIPYTDITQVSTNLQIEISNKIKPLEIISVEDDTIILVGFIFFKDSLFQTKIKVDSKGICQMFDEELIMENIPIGIK